MAGMFQGDPLPNITTTKSTATTAPDWYNAYLKNLADTGTNALHRTPEQLVAGFSPLQQQAAAKVGAAGTAYQPFMNQANAFLSNASGPATSSVQDYMNPYESSVIQGVRSAGERNIRNNIAPMAVARGVATGDPGSKRSLEIYGQTMADAQQNLTNLEAQLRSMGFTSALTAAQADKNRNLQAATTAGALGTTAQALGLGDVNALYGMGQKEQELGQARINAPLTNATNVAGLLANLKTPSTVSETSDAPIPGAYSNSPLSQIAGLSTLFASGAGGSTPVGNFTNLLGQAYSGLKQFLPSFGGTGGTSGTGDSYYNGVGGTGNTGQGAAEQYGGSGSDVRGGGSFGGTGSGLEYQATGGLDPSLWTDWDYTKSTFAPQSYDYNADEYSDLF